MAVAAIAGCGGSGGHPPSRPDLSPAIDPAGAHVAVKVSRLIGLWSVRASGEPRSTVLRVAPDEVAVWRSCGPIGGSWRALTDGTFVASMYGGSEPCFRGTPHVLSTIPWLTHARGFVFDGAHTWRLVAGDGATLATLTPGPTPTAPMNVAQSEADPPTMTAKERQQLDRVPAPLPAGTTPVTAADLVGTWRPTGSAKGSVTFHRSGTYTGSDGCNGVGGRWAVSSGGAEALTTGASTLVYCGGVQVANWFAAAARVAVNGDSLVLYDAKGAVMHRVRSTR